MSIVRGPILGELADLGVWQRGIGTLAEQLVHHAPLTAQSGVVQSRAREIKPGRDEVHPCPQTEQIVTVSDRPQAAA